MAEITDEHEMTESPQEYIRAMKPRYLTPWHRIIVDFLERDEQEWSAFVEVWQPFMDNDGLMCYHELPEYYVSPLLLPRDLPDFSDPMARTRLSWELYRVIGRFDRQCGLDPACFQQMRAEIDETIANWLAVNCPAPQIVEGCSETSKMPHGPGSE